MKRHFPLFFFLPIAIFLFANTWAQGLPEIVINNADATTTIELFAPPMDFFDASEASFRLPNEAAVCRADERLTIDLAAPADDFFDAGEAPFRLPNQAAICRADEEAVIDLIAPLDDFFDASEANFRLPNEAAVCRADERLTINLVRPPAEFFDPALDVKILSKTPVIFVPGLLGTEISDGRDLLWLDVERIVSLANDDSFLDVLSFDGNLLPISELKLSDVIKEKNYSLFNTINFHYDYSRGLIDEFTAQGYDADEDSEDQTFYTFPYDWRYGASGIYPKSDDVSQIDVTNSVLLGRQIEELAKISPTGRVDVIAHSLGGLIAKKYVLESDDPKIGKLVFVGVPNLGAPLAGRALIAGTDFGVFGLNPQELKKISQNMPAAYDLLPSETYFSAKGEWMNIVKPTSVFGINETKTLDWAQTRIYLAGAGMNGAAIAGSIALHDANFDGDFANDIFGGKGVDAYNIAGCKSATFSVLRDWQNKDGTHSHYEFFQFANGDDTVPFESANRKLAKDENTFYAPKTKHGQMPSLDGVRQKIAAIVSGQNVSVSQAKIISRPQLLANVDLCKLYGTTIKIESPLAIKITDNLGNTIEYVENVGPKNEIPGAGFEIIGEKKFVYLPRGGGEQYQIDLRGTDNGFFTLTTQTVENDILQEQRVFGAIPVSVDSRGKLEIYDQETILEIDNNGDGKTDQAFAQDDDLTIYELIENLNRYIAQGLIKKPQSIILAAQFRVLEKQFLALEKLKANNKLPQKANVAAVEASIKLINKQIDLLVKEIQGMAEKENVNEQIAKLMIEGLNYIKITP